MKKQWYKVEYFTTFRVKSFKDADKLVGKMPKDALINEIRQWEYPLSFWGKVHYTILLWRNKV